MNRDLVLRRERPDDLEPTRALHDLAFGVPEGAEHSLETRILDRLRAEGDVLDALTLVADLHGEVVGHVVCSRATMGEGPSVALGPVAVHPDHQGAGHRLGARGGGARHGRPRRGSRRSSCSATRAGTRHFGFQTAADHGIGSPGPWADRFFQVRPLQAWRPELAGAFRYPPAFDLARRPEPWGERFGAPPPTGNLGHRVWLGPGPGAELLAARRGTGLAHLLPGAPLLQFRR